MTVTTTVWVVSLAVAALILAFDLWTVARRPHEPSHREALSYLGVYIGLAVLFGVGLWVVSGSTAAGEFYAGWITEYSLSVDNLFVFLLIMRAFAVPQRNQQTALLVGIVLALVLRGIVIVVGGVAIEHLSWVFYLFGAFLIWTAITVGRSSSDEDENYEPPLAVRLFRRWVPSTPDYHGVRLTVRHDGRRLATPMLMVLVALGVTDLLFALDSIPAVFGVTKVPYLVLMANVFALMGLRQLYFLLGGLLTRLVYLNIGLAVLLGFIGVKLVLEALHQNALGFINGGRPVSWAPELSAGTSLAVIVGVLAVTAVASLLRERRTADVAA